MRSASTAELFFENCRVPAENLLGEEGRGFIYFMETLDRYRPHYAAQSVGIAQAAFEASVDYAKTRIQFGQPIGSFQANSFKIVRMATLIETARSLVFKTAWLADQGKRYSTEAAMARFWASEVAMWVTTETLQIHGGYGLMEESPLHR